MKGDLSNFYYASNELPPKHCLEALNKLPDTSLGMVMASDEFDSWDKILFVCFKTKSGEELFPVAKEHMDKKVTDFKFLFRV